MNALSTGRPSTVGGRSAEVGCILALVVFFSAITMFSAQPPTTLPAVAHPNEGGPTPPSVARRSEPGPTATFPNGRNLAHPNEGEPPLPSVARQSEGGDDKHLLAIGDHVSFRILEDLEDPMEPRDPKPLTVSDTGELEIPYIGRFLAEGKTCKQLAEQLKVELERDYYYQATVVIAVDLMAKSRGRVYLVGPVRLPGPQEIPSDEVLTLGKAIMRAGGFTDFADRRSVKVTRKGGAGDADKKTFVVDVGQIFDKGKVEKDMPLEPGDLILIPERAIRF